MILTHNEPLVDGEWLRARIGKLTASRMKDAIDFKANGDSSEKRKKYMMELVAERMTDIVVPHYVTPAMQWGLDNESEAKLAYMERTKYTIRPAGFIDHPRLDFCGATPDSFVDPDGLLETKCPTTTVHIGWIRAGVVPMEHRPQMALQLLCTGRDWCDFASYDPRMPEGKRLFIRRFQPEKEYLEKIEELAGQFLAEVEALFRAVTEAEMV